ncbi:hypothetical protein PNEG_02789 [Pneumocystis murina B123]|uniref:CBM21 domain-containing protein n=1 Tax=Pneumocystis murina (strain B123) TaxID=1069680 RepID=M7PEX2_PNEMU|nr:hypothetical protein PNEG_02789 [Pneumocystis murina B123]EMR09014.1 hypothetical protein PNEG_02789 [Pneumocystis murina B123]
MPYMPPSCSSLNKISASVLKCTMDQKIEKEYHEKNTILWDKEWEELPEIWFSTSSKQMKEDMFDSEKKDIKKKEQEKRETRNNMIESIPEYLSNSLRMDNSYKYTREWEEWNNKEWQPWEVNEEKQELQKLSNYLRKVSSSPSFESTLSAYGNTTKELNLSTNLNLTESTDALEDSNRLKVVRKKSGELVKSSLKSEKHKRPQSMPSTPILHKNVQFATKLEEIKHFSQAEKPEEVSKSGLVDESYQDIYGMAFDYDLYDLKKEEKNSDLTIELVNFENSGALCLSQNVQLETVYLSSDKRHLLGRVAVKNISFEKIVGIRFTMDFWQTISEVNAEYTDDILTKQYKDNLDRFVFNIKLHELMNIEDKTLYLCVRYRIPGEEFWDNNSGMNYKIGFKRKFKTHTRPFTHFPAFSLGSRYLDDDFNTESDSHLSMFQSYKNDPFHVSLMNDSTNTKQSLRKKDNFANIFSNRYDFSTSLTAAIKASGTTNYNESKNNDSKTKDINSYEDSIENVDLYFSDLFLVEKPLTRSQSNISFGNDISNTLSLNDTKLSTSFQENKNACDLFKGSSKPSVDSVLYQNFLDSYCFFRGSDKINTQDAESITYTGENPEKNIPSISHKKSNSSSSLSSINEFIPFSSFSGPLFYSQSSLSSISSVDSVSNVQQPSESKTSIDLYYNHLINSSLTLETPGGALTAIRT